MDTGKSGMDIPMGESIAATPYLIEQDYGAYSADQHVVWAELVERRMPQLRDHACTEYLDGLRKIGLDDRRIPDLKAISARLRPLTGWSSTPVSGFLPPMAFFEMLRARMFPTTAWLRSRDSLDYTPMPDIFHDVFGHVPMHAHPVFADFLQHYGHACAALIDRPDALEQMGRIFWFTVEFGVIRQAGELKVYGSGLISSHGECTRVLSGDCDIRKFDLDAVMNQEVDTGAMQPILYVVDSFEEIFNAAKAAAARLK
jgi:phenylalanine-4-hydroxylase